MGKMDINELWNCNDENEWNRAKEEYWSRIRARGNIVYMIEIELDDLHERIRFFADFNQHYPTQDAEKTSWYIFLHDKYVPWKFEHRWVPTRQQNLETGTREEIEQIGRDLFEYDKQDIGIHLSRADRIPGFAVIAASGLIALMFPEYFGTVDQYVLNSLKNIDNLPKIEDVNMMNPENLTNEDGIKLIEIMRGKARRLNEMFITNFWTPRKIDMILWTKGH